MIITILTDNPQSWFINYGDILNDRLVNLGHKSRFVQDKNEIQKGDVCFLLSCTKILSKEYLSLNEYNIVIHASDLPEGKGFSPLQWQILEGKDFITLTLFKAIEELDAGDFFLKEQMHFEGHELFDELHNIMGLKIIEMAEKFILNINNLIPMKQNGNSTFYQKRTQEDDKLDPNKTIIELFNHFRIANNDQYPLYFEHKGYKYNLKIEKRND